MVVVKRDGRKIDFDKSKIKNAVESAYMEVDGYIDKASKTKAREIAYWIEKEVEQMDECDVETIQDMVQKKLMKSSREDVAEAYIIYRNDRNRIRQSNSQLSKLIKEKITASNVQNQNANVDEKSFGGRMGSVQEEVLKEYALNHCMSDMARNNHLNNEIYTHDLAHYPAGDHNCLSIPIDDFANNPILTRQVDLRPCKSINSFGQISAVVKQLQSLQQFGGVSYTHYDHSAVPYVRMSLMKHYIMEYIKTLDELLLLDLLEMSNDDLDDWIHEHKEAYFNKFGLKEADFYIGTTNPNIDKRLYTLALLETKRETYQAMEALFHNLNSLQSRSGNQLPFSSINYGTCTLPEGRMVTRAILEVSIKGLGMLHRTSIFPCQIFQLMKGVNREKGDPNYDLYQLALKSTAQRLYPNYANVDWSGNAGYDRNDPKTYFSTMGKRKL